MLVVARAVAAYSTDLVLDLTSLGHVEHRCRVAKQR
jgi:hypothetical protein